MADGKLKSKYTLWVFDDQAKVDLTESTESFNEKLKPIAGFSTVAEFWEIFQYMKKPSEFAQESDVYLFKEGIKPLWEDPLNERGGYFTIKIEKNKSDKVWENAVLACITPTRETAACINGVRVKTKDEVDIIQVWMNSSAQESIAEVKQYLKDSLQVTDDKVFAFFLFSYHLKSLKTKERRDTGALRGRGK